MSEPKNKAKSAAAICCAAILTAESAVPSFAAAEVVKPKDTNTSDNNKEVVRGLPAPFFGFIVTDRGGDTNISDVKFTIRDSWGFDTSRSFAYLKDGDVELERIHLDGNRDYSFTTKTLPEGVYTLGFVITSPDGLEDKGTQEFIVDNTLPVIELKSNAVKEIETNPVEVVAKFTDANLDRSKTEVKVTKDGQPFDVAFAESENLTMKATFTEDGDYEIVARTADKRGNKGEDQKISFRIDRTAPKVEVTNMRKKVSLLEDRYVTSFSEVFPKIKERNFKEMSIEIKKGMQTVYTDKLTTLPANGEVAIRDFNAADGDYTLLIHAEDMVGNVSNERFEFTKDWEVPVVTFEGIEDKGITNKDIPFKAIINDKNLDTSSIHFEILKDGKAMDIKGPFTDTILKSLTEAGQYEVMLFCQDKAMNKTSKSMTFEIDKTLPVINAKNLHKNEDLKKDNHIKSFNQIQPVIVESNVKKISVTIRKDGRAVYTDDLFRLPENGEILIRNFRGKDGVYELNVRVEDKAGNIKEENIEFIKDNEGPAITFEGLKPFFNADFNLKTIIADDSFDIKDVKYEVIKDGNVIKTNENYKVDSIEDLFTLEGKYEVNVIAKDKTLNESRKTASFEIDKTLPVIKVENLLKKESLKTDNHVRNFSEIEVFTNDKNFEFVEIKVMKDSRVVYQDKRTELPSDKKVKLKNFSEKDGRFVLLVKTKDKAGNVSEESIEFLKDADAPVIVFEGINGFTNKDFTLKTLFKDMDLDLSSIVYKVFKDGSEIKSNETLLNDIIEEIFSDEGEYTVKVNAKDNSLNEGEGVISFEIDKELPKIEVKNLLKKEALNADNHIRNFNEIQPNVKDKNLSGVIVRILKDEKPVYERAIKDFKNDNNIEIENFEGVDGKYTLVVTAKDKANNISEERVDFIKDTKGPEISFEGVKDFTNKDFALKNILKDENLDLSSVKITVNRNGKNIKEEFVNKGTFEELFSEEGEYTVTINAKDLSLNESRKSVSFEVDKTLPTIESENLLKETALSKDNHVKSFSDLEITVKEKNLNKISVLIKDGEKVVYEDKYDKMPAGGKIKVKGMDIKDGNYTLEVKVSDKAGNNQTEIVDFIKDTKAPTITFKGAEKFFNKEDVQLEALIKDLNLDVSSIKYQVSKNGEFVKLENVNRDNIKEVFALEGEYEIKVIAKDLSLNEAEKVISFEVDKTLPETVISGIPQHGYLHKLSEINIKSEDKNFEKQTIKIVKDGKVVLAKENLKDKNVVLKDGLSDGRYEIIVEAEDKAGNVKITKDKFVIDNAAPIISFDGVIDGKYYNRNVTLNINVNEENFKDNTVNVKITKKLRGRTTEIPFSFTSSNVLSKNSKVFSEDGTYTITVNSTDKVGNVAREKSITFTVDKTTPTIKVDNLLNTYGPKGDIDSTITIEDDYKDKTSVTVVNKKTGKSITASLNRGEYVDVYSIKGIKKVISNDGNYSVVISAEDKAGNKFEKSEGFVVNRFGSSFSFVNKPKAIQKKLKEDVKIRESNLSSIDHFEVRITRDGKKVKDIKGVTRAGGVYTIPKENFAKSGVYKIDIISTDTAGNTSEMIKSEGCDYKFVIDKDAPSLYLVGAKDREVYKQNSLKIYIEATDSITGIKDVKATVNGMKVEVLKEEDTEKLYIELKEGFNQNIKVEITDNAGNTQKAELKRVTVSTGIRASIMQHKLVSGLIAFVTLISGFFIFLFKRKKDDDEEEGK